MIFDFYRVKLFVVNISSTKKKTFPTFVVFEKYFPL